MKPTSGCVIGKFILVLVLIFVFNAAIYFEQFCEQSFSQNIEVLAANLLIMDIVNRNRINVNPNSKYIVWKLGQVSRPRVWTAASQQHKIDNQPLATIRISHFSLSHSDASIFEKILFSHYKAVVYPWECWSKFLVVGCPSTHQSRLNHNYQNRCNWLAWIACKCFVSINQT